MIDLDYFFDHVRDTVFGGKLTKAQVDGMKKILEYRDLKWAGMSNDELAYLLATTAWETGFKMAPVREMGGERYLRSKKYYPWVGEGLVQVTWEENARKFGATKPGDLLTWPIALRAAFEGMIKGMFTGKKLADYIKPGKKPDYLHARKIINGMDKAHVIENLAYAFQHALTPKKA